MSHISTLTCIVPSAHSEPVLCWSCVFTSHLVSFLLLSSLHFWSFFVSYLFKLLFFILFLFLFCLVSSSFLISSPLFSSLLLSSYLISSPFLSSCLVSSSLIYSRLIYSRLISSHLVSSYLLFLSRLISFPFFLSLSHNFSYLFHACLFLPSHLVSSGLFSLMSHFCFLGGFCLVWCFLFFVMSSHSLLCLDYFLSSNFISSHRVSSLLSYVSFLLVLTH